MKSPLLLVSGLALTLMFSCNKKVDNPEPAKTKTQLLTAQTWKIQTVEARTYVGADPGSAPYINITSQVPACNLDNLTIFLAAGTYELNEGASKCATANPQIVSAGTWAFANSETRINVVTGSGTQAFEVVSMSETQMVLTTVLAGSGGSNTQTKTTFVH